jgi:DNA-binding GntR family transcriptional regulator
MSYLPATQALQRLEDDGLVESRPRAGTRVRIPSDREIRERYVLREALECQSARLCSENATFEEHLQLQRMAEDLDALYDRCAAEEVDSDFLFAVHTAHFNVHLKIAECARCDVLQKAIERNQVLIFNWLYDLAAGRRSLPSHFHRRLVEGILQSDQRVAEETMREHIRYGLEGITTSIKPQADQGWRVKQQK